MDNYIILLLVVIIGFTIYYYCEINIGENIKNKQNKKNIKKQKKQKNELSSDSSENDGISMPSIKSKLSIDIDDDNQSKISLNSNDFLSECGSKISLNNDNESELSFMKN